MLSRVVLVTGGTGTIGSAIVRSLCTEPAYGRDVPVDIDGGASVAKSVPQRVVANYAHDEQRALSLQRETGCEIFRADVGDEFAVESLLATCLSAGASLDAVVHAAGITRDALLLRQTRADWHESLRINVDGTFLVTRAALKYLIAGGRLVLLSSLVGEYGNAGQAAYAAGKAAMNALMRCAAREGAQRKLCVNAVCPGFTPSAMTEKLSPQRVLAAQQRSVLGTTSETAAVVSAVRWLLSEDASGVSGQVIHCDSRIYL